MRLVTILTLTSLMVQAGGERTLMVDNTQKLIGPSTNFIAANDIALIGDWPTQWAMSAITNANWATNTEAGIINALGYTPLGASSNAVSATTASGGWPVEWPASAITNANWVANTVAGIINALGYTPLGASSNAVSATTASGGWPVEWPASAITNANWVANTVAGIINALGYTPLGASSNAVSATTASGGWPLEWPQGAITNAWSILPGTNMVAATNGTTITLNSSGGGGASRLDQLTADGAGQSLQNAAFTNQWQWALTGASQIGFDVGESSAATGGGGSQVLHRIGTLSSSTAIPLRVMSRGNIVFDIGYNATQLWNANGSSSAPTISFANAHNSGIYLSGSYSMPAISGGGHTLAIFDGSYGVTMFNANGFEIGAAVLNTGDSTPGVMLVHAVHASTAANVALFSSLIGADSRGSGSIQSNPGASGSSTYTLPTVALAGMSFTFVVRAAQALIIVGNGADTIQVAGSVSTATTGNVQAATVGNVITLTSLSTSSQPKWVATSIVGTWTVN